MRQFSIVGLPRSGKTTFLAAFWHLVSSGQTQTRYVLDRLIGDTAYLDEIVDKWQSCEEVGRTSGRGEVTIRIQLKDSLSGASIEMEFPDLSGESFEAQVEFRRCSQSYVDSLSEDSGILLFLSADRATDGATIVDLVRLTGESAPAEEAESPVAWRHEFVPEQVQLVELLQFLQGPPFRSRKRRVGVFISAWDVVSSNQPSPETWLSRERPMLFQYLKTNPEAFEFRVFGVSAQGGSYKAASRVKLLDKVPSTRVRCVGPEIEEHDLTSPLAWLAEASGELE